MIDFVTHLEMGGFYSKRIATLLSYSSLGIYWGVPSERIKDHPKEYREQLRSAKDQIYRLIIELLRFQKW